jgi:hypothetical protein
MKTFWVWFARVWGASWLLMIASAAFFNFSSPSGPRTSTSQIVAVKAFRTVYVTPLEDALWNGELTAVFATQFVMVVLGLVQWRDRKRNASGG